MSQFQQKLVSDSIVGTALSRKVDYITGVSSTDGPTFELTIPNVDTYLFEVNPLEDFSDSKYTTKITKAILAVGFGDSFMVYKPRVGDKIKTSTEAFKISVVVSTDRGATWSLTLKRSENV